jgi:hypothetical protein
MPISADSLMVGTDTTVLNLAFICHKKQCSFVENCREIDKHPKVENKTSKVENKFP